MGKAVRTRQFGAAAAATGPITLATSKILLTGLFVCVYTKPKSNPSFRPLL